MNKKLLICTALTLVSATAQATAKGSPSIAKIKIYGMALSTSADCSNATVVGYNADGVDYDFKQSPSIFSGNIAAGTYQCVILYMSSLLTFTPAAAVAPNCAAGTSYTRNVANGNVYYTPGSPDASNILTYGSLTKVKGTTSQDITNADKVLLFLSTGSIGDGSTGLAFQRPDTAGSSNGIKLGNAFTVSASGSSGTFVVNFDNQVDGSQSPCDLGPPTFTFR